MFLLFSLIALVSRVDAGAGGVPVEVVSVFPLGVIEPQEVVPAAILRNCDTLPLDVEAGMSFLLDGTEKIYQSSRSVSLPANETCTVSFDAWQAASGFYLAGIAVRRDSQAARDTFWWRIEVSPVDGWRYWGPMPRVGRWAQPAAAGNYQYVVGGEHSSGMFIRNDLESLNWDSLAPMPQSIMAGAAAIVGDTLYVHGGCLDSTWEQINRLFKYSLASDTWVSDTGCCTFNDGPSMVALDGKLYYLGGYDWVRGTVSNQTWCYTPGADTPWARLSDMHEPRLFAHAVVYEGRIYMAGGWADPAPLRSTEIYDPAANTWIQDSLEFPYLPEGRGGGAHGCALNTMFIYSGWDGFNVLRSALEYSFPDRRWTLVAGARNGGASDNFTAVANSRNEGVVFGAFPRGAAYRLYVPVGVKECPAMSPSARLAPVLGPCRPNPFRDRVLIAYSLPGHARVNLRLYDATGRLVRALDQGLRAAGRHVVDFRNPRSGGSLPAGVYVARLETEGGSVTSKVVLH